MLRLPALLLAGGLAAAAALPAAAGDASAGALTIENAWSRPGMPNRPAAAYLAVTNNGETDDELVGAASPAFGAVELHTVEMTDGVMRMMQVEAIPVPAGETVALAPGGFHVMLFDGERPFADGDGFALILTFEKAGEVEVMVDVRPRAPGGEGMDHGSMNHGTMNHGSMNHGDAAAE